MPDKRKRPSPSAEQTGDLFTACQPLAPPPSPTKRKRRSRAAKQAEAEYRRKKNWRRFDAVGD